MNLQLQLQHSAVEKVLNYPLNPPPRLQLGEKVFLLPWRKITGWPPPKGYGNLGRLKGSGTPKPGGSPIIPGKPGANGIGSLLIGMKPGLLWSLHITNAFFCCSLSSHFPANRNFQLPVPPAPDPNSSRNFCFHSSSLLARFCSSFHSSLLHHSYFLICFASYWVYTLLVWYHQPLCLVVNWGGSVMAPSSNFKFPLQL